MDSKTIIFALIISSTILLSNSNTMYANNSPENEVKKAANDGKKTLLKDFEKQKLHNFGFINQAEVDDAVVGEGFNVCTIPADKIVNYSGQEYSSLIAKTNIWQFLIKSKGKDVVMLTVDYVDGKWIPVSMGYAGLAKELRKILATWPPSAGYNYRILRIYQAKSDFIELSNNGSFIGIIPLRYGRKPMRNDEMEYNYTDLHNSKEFIENIKPIVQRNLRFDN